MQRCQRKVSQAKTFFFLFFRENATELRKNYPDHSAECSTLLLTFCVLKINPCRLGFTTCNPTTNRQSWFCCALRNLQTVISKYTEIISPINHFYDKFYPPFLRLFSVIKYSNNRIIDRNKIYCY